MILARPTLQDLRTLCADARGDEIAQWEALVGRAWDVEDVASDLLSRIGPKWTLCDLRGRPIVAGGLQYVIPGVYDCWMVGTMDNWGAHWRAITLNTNRVLRMALRTERRVELLVLESRTKACEWYERGLRMQREGVAVGYGINGENAVRYARVSQGAKHG